MTLNNWRRINPPKKRVASSAPKWAYIFRTAGTSKSLFRIKMAQGDQYAAIFA